MIFNKEDKTITTERLLLRLATENDVDRITEICNNPNVSRYLSLVPFPYSREDAIWWINTHQEGYESNKSYEFLIQEKEGLVIGAISLNIDHRNSKGEMGYWLAEDKWHQGFATEAALAIRDFGFDNVGLNKVFAAHMSENEASGNVMKNIGMIFEGELKDDVKKGERFFDMKYYGILKRNR